MRSGSPLGVAAANTPVTGRRANNTGEAWAQSLRRPSSPRIPPVQRILDVMSERRDMSQPGAYNIGATVGTNRTVGNALGAYARVLAGAPLPGSSTPGK